MSRGANGRSRRGPRRRPAFTLVELLAVIGIMAVLIGILVPTVISVRRASNRNAARMDLQTISQALDAYKADFGDYPRPPTSEPRTRVLAWALIGPYPAVNGPTNPYVPSQTMSDGADGPGFRTVVGTGSTGGKVWGPYLPPDKFKLSSPTYADTEMWDIMDRFEKPIEYFPRWRMYRSDPTTPANTTCLFGGAAASTGHPNVYDFQQQFIANPTTSSKPNADSQVMRYLRVSLGDDYTNKDPTTGGTPPNDLIDGKDVKGEMPPYILISPGPPGEYPDDKSISNQFSKCEVITNLQH